MKNLNKFEGKEVKNAAVVKGGSTDTDFRGRIKRIRIREHY